MLYAGGKQYLYLYDPKPRTDGIVIDSEHRVILRHIMKTVTPGLPLKGTILLPKTQYNRQAANDYTSCGVYVCRYAKDLVTNGCIRFTETFNVQLERQTICSILEELYRNQNHKSSPRTNNSRSNN